jgi:hypothetical protein
MSKKIFALLLALVMVLGLVACGAEKPAETKAPETQAPETTPITEAPAVEKGCGGMISGAVAVIALLGTAIVFKKKD